MLDDIHSVFKKYKINVSHDKIEDFVKYLEEPHLNKPQNDSDVLIIKTDSSTQTTESFIQDSNLENQVM